mmetsp:Transcript_21804/g.33524  ORF Transcript_21804/g.33524 Transcript_21804/m.33524 type:complete len:88 (+) Transcript_21804:644-907(+)
MVAAESDCARLLCGNSVIAAPIAFDRTSRAAGGILLIGYDGAVNALGTDARTRRDHGALTGRVLAAVIVIADSERACEDATADSPEF